MWVERIYTPGLAVNTYLVGNSKSGEAVVIDPTRDSAPILNLAVEKRAKIKAILETHIHADFVSGACELKAALKGQPLIYCSAMGGEMWVPQYADAKVHDGDCISLGSSKLIALHTPGHTMEHLCWIAYEGTEMKLHPWGLFSGDALFVGSIGRPDLLGEEMLDTMIQESYHTIFERLGSLPDYLEVLPAHGLGSACGKGIKSRSSSTLGYERRHNPFFQRDSIENWKQHLLLDMPPRPPYYLYLKNKNLMMLDLLKSTHPLPKVRFADISESDQVIDVRLPLDFAKNHLPQSINISLSPNFINWVGQFINIEQPIVLVGSSEDQILKATQRLCLIGADLIKGAILLHQNSSEESLRRISILDAYELYAHVKAVDVAIIDVRTDEEWNAGHIAQAKHLPLSQIVKQIDTIPKEIPLVVICASGVRSSTAASILIQHGFKQVSNLKGGMQAWKEAALPIINQ